jgi:hypothetical protein
MAGNSETETFRKMRLFISLPLPLKERWDSGQVSGVALISINYARFVMRCLWRRFRG